ncbi:DegQ family serine endoprotease [Geomonas sp.]|uniref:DegQ family serine endoprotease n=1 Tax=Geomonas sp. TaxID=2651584 RepID=UPI002B495864|nr:DegQ family serine endoprotease [Geomonas sp.]HJV33719.1 DegQ family serine endoprotease [Geomonas sp.]
MSLRWMAVAGRSFVMSMFFVIACVSTGGCESKGRTEVIGFPQSFADLAEKVAPAVVNISTTSKVKVPGTPFNHFFGGGGSGGGDDEDQQFRDFFKKYFGNMPDREMKQQSLGSGFIIDDSGLIITNNHMIEGAEEIKVKLADGREFKAKVTGRDPKTDLALIKISSTFGHLPSLQLGDSDKVRVGDWVLAVGIPFGLEHTVTQGIISATGRVIGSGPYDNFLQTDAPINPGNSGGPLVNMKGEVIGINTAIVSGGQGLGFAIPSSLAKSVISQLKEKGKVVRGWIGISIQTLTPELAQSFGLKDAKGALVGDVLPGGPADKGGIQRGDVIVSYNGKAVKDANDLPRLVAETPVGKEVAVALIRDGKEESHIVKVQEMTEEKVAAQSPENSEQSFGMELEELTPQLRQHLGIAEKSGLVVDSVEEGTPAEDAGIESGDVITEVDRKAVHTAAEFKAAVAKAKGRPVLLLVKRGKQSFFASLQPE